METWHILIAMAVGCAVIAAALFAIPGLVTKLTRPSAGLEFFMIFTVLAVGLGLFLWISISIPVAFTVAIIRYESRTRAAEQGTPDGGEFATRPGEPRASGEHPKEE
jgi:hypothetical protein